MIRKSKLNKQKQQQSSLMGPEIYQRAVEEAERIGVPRTSLIKLWIAQHLDELAG